MLDFEDIHRQWQALSAVGENPDHSVTRLLYTPEYDRAAEQLQDWMHACGLQVTRDSVHNIHGFLPASTPGARTLYLGSHLDTVREGGHYDGILGVVAAVGCAAALKKSGLTRHFNLQVIATNGEEGNDLGGTFGSRCLMGLVDYDQPGFAPVARSFGVTREQIADAKLELHDPIGYLELHIEQGPTLDKSGEDLGIVSGIVGLRRYQVTVKGEANHAGTTMMEYRHDALVAASRLVLAVDRLVREYGHQMVATVGKLSVFPNQAPVIPGRVEFVLEMRSQTPALMEELLERVQKEAAALQGVEVDFAPLVEKPPVDCDAGLVQIMQDVCRQRADLRWRVMTSGATHDGNAFALRMPLGMLFVPSVAGISHSGREFTAWPQIVNGIQVLYQTLLAINQAEEKGGI